MHKYLYISILLIYNIFFFTNLVLIITSESKGEFIAYLIYCFLVNIFLTYYSILPTTISSLDHNKSLEQKLKDFFYKKFSFSMNFCCQHYESDSEGYYLQITYKDQVPIMLSSFRDISGHLEINTDKKFIFLQIITKFEFADDETKEYVKKLKEDLTKKFKDKDKDFTIEESLKVEDLKFNTTLLVENDIGNKPLFFNKAFLWVSIILNLSAFYLLICLTFYVNEEPVKFTIKKLISRRQNVYNEENEFKYKNEVPKLVINGDLKVFDDPPNKDFEEVFDDEHVKYLEDKEAGKYQNK